MQQTEMRLTKDHTLHLHVLVALERIVDEPKFPAGFALQQQHADGIVGDGYGKCFCVVVLTGLAGTSADTERVFVAADFIRFELKLELHGTRIGGHRLRDRFPAHALQNDFDFFSFKARRIQRRLQRRPIVFEDSEQIVEVGDGKIFRLKLGTEDDREHGRLSLTEPRGDEDRIAVAVVAAIGQQHHADQRRSRAVAGAGRKCLSEIRNTCYQCRRGTFDDRLQRFRIGPLDLTGKDNHLDVGHLIQQRQQRRRRAGENAPGNLLSRQAIDFGKNARQVLLVKGKSYRIEIQVVHDSVRVCRPKTPRQHFDHDVSLGRR
ncbi:MAG: hypothetical protein IID49_07765 [Proteobacteria bacterium]|nr:hypothetical protein [Pseudomonadota bacterium]